jgi:hypothetical protein
MYSTGFTTGRKKAFIPWGLLVKDPLTFITKECTPDGFEWKDPSKIRIREVFRLLYHWRSRQDEGLLPLVWVPTCSLFQDQDEPSSHPRHSQKSKANDSNDSDEEQFHLPSFGECGDDDNADEGGQYSGGNEPKEHFSSGRQSSFEEHEDNADADHGANYDSENEPDYSTSSCGQPNERSAEDAPEYINDEGNESDHNPSDSGEPGGLSMAFPPLDDPYMHQSFSGMCPLLCDHCLCYLLVTRFKYC